MPTRRSFLSAGPLGLLSGRTIAAAEPPQRVLVTGGHPDDPETGCGGTLAALAEAGVETHVMYLTRGEAGIEGKPPAEAARIRTAEAEAACRILGAVPHFAGQTDGAAEVTPAAYDAVQAIVDAIRPDTVLTHWPIDTHRDHRICSLLTYDAWLRVVPEARLLYYEVMTGTQTQTFSPTLFLDITAAEPTKRRACEAHVSQNLAAEYDGTERTIAQFRGRQSGHELAEAFVPHATGAAAAAW